MGLALLAFTTMFILVLSLGLILFYREAVIARLASVISPRVEGSSMLRPFGTAGPAASIEAMVQPFQRVLPRSPKEVSVLQKRLIRAGYREEKTANVFYGAKVLSPVVLCALAAATGAYALSPIFVFGLGAALGFLIPDFWLGSRISARKLEIRLGLPEALDLIVICIEAGLSLDHATLRTADELKLSEPAISDEFSLLGLEQRAGRPRADAWKHLAERTDVDVVRALVAMLIQADQFGSSIAKTLRVHSETLRTQRRQGAEEQAAKTAVKLVFPLVLFIFPSLFVVTLGPSMILMFQAFQKFLLN